MSVFRTGAAARLLPTEGATALRAPRKPSEARPLLQAVQALPRSRRAPRSAGETPPRASDLTQRYTRLAQAFAMTAEAETAYADLDHALLLARERGQEVPCLGPGAEAWTSDDYDDQQLAADRCWDCPALFLCERYAEVADEKAGVWGGRAFAEKPQVGAGNCEEISRDVFMENEGNSTRSTTKIGYPMTAKNTPAMKTSPNFGTEPTGNCFCPCGEPTGKKAKYRPGHDARHVSILIEALPAKFTQKDLDGLIVRLPSAPLQAKFQRAAERLAAKATAEPKDAA